ncbi:MAG: class I tRNA ligase family protein, partial [Thermoplasmata archaeon]|nr:class I tRNA ligase family protein [Thermoplasmata archaeon]
MGSIGVLAERYRPGDTERSARELWAARGFPRGDGVVGRSTAPIVRQFEGTLTPGDDPALVALRAVAADADARYLALAGRRALGTLRRDGEPPEEVTENLLRALSVWTGGAAGQPVDSADRRSQVEAILGRMAARGLVATRDSSLRICPSCGQARSPERIIYQQEEGDTYLIRFPIPEGDGYVQALVWVDAPWRLLGASALLVNPNLPYVIARYRRRGVDERILTSRPSLERIQEWLPGAELEVLEEGPGSRWQGRAYQYPLRNEFPMGGDLLPPAGTVLAVPDVGDSGTGIVPLVPGHGGTDAQIADRLGVSGWPLVTARGQLATNLSHKYSGLDVPTASEFVARDLSESGGVFARLRVRRGVPHCSICGTALVWAPGRAWCLEPSRLPPERRDLYHRLLPRDPPVGQVEVAAWPVSEPQTSSPGPRTVTLLECPRCERLEPLGAGPKCPCGAQRNPVSRRLLPSISGALGAWARFDPFPPGDSVWLYMNERRRAPTLVHHLAVMASVPGVPSDVGLTLLPGVPEGGLPELAVQLGADALRAALVRGQDRERAGLTFADRCHQEARRLERWWNLARETLDRCDPSLLATFSQPIAGSLAELEPEDRAVLARWERVRLAALADYDHQAPGVALRRVARFLANDLETYNGRVRTRLDKPGTTPSRRAALRTLHYMLRGSAVLLAPVAPHIAETVYGALVPGRTSLFESSIDPLDSTLLDEDAIRAWDRWGSVLHAVDRFRRSVGLGPTVPVPVVTVLVGTDEMAQSLRTDRPTIERLTNVTRFEAFGPSGAWPGRQRSVEPVVAEIQRAYPAEASQILHVLRRMPARRRSEAGATDELSVVVHGLSRKIFPSMVEYVERLPDRVVAVPWALGEMYAQLPAHQPVPTRTPPPVSPDAFRLISRVERALAKGAARAPPETGPVLIAALDPLASELRGVGRPLALYFGVPEVRVVAPGAEFLRADCLFGRTRTGVRWWVLLPGRARRLPRTKHREHRAALPRVRPHLSTPELHLGEVDFTSDEEVTRGEQIRTLGQDLDAVLGAPLMGPTKVAGAWALGLRSVADFGSAPFEQIMGLPGFGRPIAESLVSKLGGVVPPGSRGPETGRSTEASSVVVVPDPPPFPPYSEVRPPPTGTAGPRGTDGRPSRPAPRALATPPTLRVARREPSPLPSELRPVAATPVPPPSTVPGASAPVQEATASPGPGELGSPTRPPASPSTAPFDTALPAGTVGEALPSEERAVASDPLTGSASIEVSPAPGTVEGLEVSASAPPPAEAILPPIPLGGEDTGITLAPETSLEPSEGAVRASPSDPETDTARLIAEIAAPIPLSSFPPEPSGATPDSPEIVVAEPVPPEAAAEATEGAPSPFELSTPDALSPQPGDPAPPTPGPLSGNPDPPELASPLPVETPAPSPRLEDSPGFDPGGLAEPPASTPDSTARGDPSGAAPGILPTPESPVLEPTPLASPDSSGEAPELPPAGVPSVPESPPGSPEDSAGTALDPTVDAASVPSDLASGVPVPGSPPALPGEEDSPQVERSSESMTGTADSAEPPTAVVPDSVAPAPETVPEVAAESALELDPGEVKEPVATSGVVVLEEPPMGASTIAESLRANATEAEPPAVEATL